MYKLTRLLSRSILGLLRLNMVEGAWPEGEDGVVVVNQMLV